jgi:hypothetical protein
MVDSRAFCVFFSDNTYKQLCIITPANERRAGLTGFLNGSPTGPNVSTAGGRRTICHKKLQKNSHFRNALQFLKHLATKLLKKLFFAVLNV